MFTLNTATNRYEGVARGSLISVSVCRVEDDAHNRTQMMDRAQPYGERLERAMAHILSNPEIYRAKNNGYSVQVSSAKR